MKSSNVVGRFSSRFVAAGFALLHLCSSEVLGTSQVPALFVLGDSLVDDGNNNYLNSLAKSNYYPYGIDFDQGPTGRFSNGRTVIDVLCELLGLPYIPAYTTPGLNGTRLLNGVNYASAAAGILEETGQYLGERFNLNQQVLNFQENLNELRVLMGGGRNFSNYLARSIVVIVFGSNDYINNYLLPSLYTTSSNYNPEEFANLLLNHLTRQLLALYSVGLQKFLLAGVGPLGCIPNQRATGLAPPDHCIDQVNQMVGYFNVGLRKQVQQLNTNHPGAICVFGNTYAALGDILNNPRTFGFSVVDRGCCGLGRNQGQITCLPLAMPCPNRDEYVFWDAFHPTEAVNKILGQRAFGGTQNDCYPVNVQQLAQL